MLSWGHVTFEAISYNISVIVFIISSEIDLSIGLLEVLNLTLKLISNRYKKLFLTKTNMLSATLIMTLYTSILYVWALSRWLCQSGWVNPGYIGTQNILLLSWWFIWNNFPTHFTGLSFRKNPTNFLFVVILHVYIVF